MPLKLKKAVKQYPELKKLTVEAVQNDASHFDYLGPSIFSIVFVMEKLNVVLLNFLQP